MVGCPHSITNKKYERNALIFNVVFVFDSKCNTQPFETVVEKLCKYFMEAEVGAMFKPNFGVVSLQLVWWSDFRRLLFLLFLLGCDTFFHYFMSSARKAWFYSALS